MDRLDYIRKTFCAETPEMRKARAEGDIAVTPETGALLHALIRLGGLKKIVEIGTLAGYSALWMAGALPEDGLLITLEKDEERAKGAAVNIGHDSRIRLVVGDAFETLPALEKEGPFDMVFIDAEKLHYAHYLDWAEKNVRKGGLIVGDNTFLFGAVLTDDPVDRVRETARATMRAFNSRLADPAKYAGVMIDTPEGLTVAVKMF
jgi:caffeoyl-CoA O-methyltransferase